MQILFHIWRSRTQSPDSLLIPWYMYCQNNWKTEAATIIDPLSLGQKPASYSLMYCSIPEVGFFPKKDHSMDMLLPKANNCRHKILETYNNMSYTLGFPSASISLHKIDSSEKMPFLIEVFIQQLPLIM